MSSPTHDEREVRRVLRGWILSAAAAGTEGACRADPAGLTDTTPIIDDRYLTSLQITDLILFLEDLRGVEVDIEDLTPGTFRDIDTIYRTFFAGRPR